MQQLRCGLVFGDENCYVGTMEKDNFRVQFADFEKLMKSSFEATRSVVNYVREVQKTSLQGIKNNINLSAQKKISDANISAAISETEDYISSLQAELEAEEEEMHYRIEQCKLEVEEKMKEFSINFDAAMKKSQTLFDLMNKHRQLLDEVQKKIEARLKQLTENYTGRKEFIHFCDEKRRTLELIENLLGHIV